MPRQLPKKTRLSHQPKSPMLERPELAVYVARIVTGWSRVEERLGFLIVQMLGAHAHTGMKMYQALSGGLAQLAVLRAVARDRLSDEQQDELETILEKFRKTAKKRNKIVHGFWDISNDLPDALIWCDSADSLIRHSEFWSGWTSHATEADQLAWLRDVYKGTPNDYLIYEKRDFEEILHEISSLAGEFSEFYIRFDRLKQASRDEAGLGDSEGAA